MHLFIYLTATHLLCAEHCADVHVTTANRAIQLMGSCIHGA